VIDPARFACEAALRGWSLYTGVPCSYLAPLLDVACADPACGYVSAANEGDAVAIAAGAALGGRRALVFLQNSGLGNAVNPLASLTHTFGIPVLLLIGMRGQPGSSDEPQHRRMGAITEPLLDALQIPWEVLPHDPDALGAALDRAARHMEHEHRPYALLASKTSFAAARGTRLAVCAARKASRCSAPRDAEPVPMRQRPMRRDVLERLVELTPESSSVLIATTGHTSRELFEIADRPNQFYMVGSMGCASALGLGLSLARPGLRVVVADGDGALLMRMGNLATLGAYGATRLLHVVLDNEAHQSTGGQPTLCGGVSFARIAAACGYGFARETSALDSLGELAQDAAARAARGPRLLQIKIRPTASARLGRPDIGPEQVRERFARHLAGMTATLQRLAKRARRARAGA
jgi:phosphonopyruvate decarboxylase